MRIARYISFVILSALCIPAFGASFDSKAPDEQSITALEQRASQAQPREQCFLYAQLVHEMIEFSAQQYATGEADKASGWMKKALDLTHKLTGILAVNDKKLKDAQILLRHTAFRLTELLRSGNSDDQELVQQTLAQLNRAQDEAMLQVFKK